MAEAKNCLTYSEAGVDIDAGAIKSARQICEFNALDIALRQHREPDNILKGVIKPQDIFHVTMCNPPFHASIAQANKGTMRKWQNLGQGHSNKLNFGGQGGNRYACLGDFWQKQDVYRGDKISA